MTETPTEVKFWAGETITSAGKRLVDAACQSGRAVGTFNGVELTAQPGTTADDVVRWYDSEWERRSREWAESAEGKASIAAREEERKRLQAVHDDLIAKLETLDFKDDAEVIDWLSQMVDPSDRIGVSIDRARILEAFKAHGLVPNMNVGPEFKSSDRQIFYRWLVGQALDGIEKISIHGIFHKFAREWREKFVQEAE